MTSVRFSTPPTCYLDLQMFFNKLKMFFWMNSKSSACNVRDMRVLRKDVASEISLPSCRHT